MTSSTPSPASSPHLITAAIYSALASSNPQSAEAFMRLYREAEDPDPAAQIANANRFWRMQLGSIAYQTVEIRECLIDNCDPMDWVRLFATQVAPTIVAFGLPRPCQDLDAFRLIEAISL